MKLNEICAGCGLKVTKDLQTENVIDGVVRKRYADPCLGKLPGVKFACCGHGETGGYIFFENGRVIRFNDLIVERIMVSPYHKFNDETTVPKHN